ncbi:MAG: hypothetical protein ABWX68_14510 [Arthrobacter sp.]|uniref:hypothetical protein n=1 Tax=Arthrobacter sp. TaxID=1667 RepID=UPI00348A7361
MAIVLRGLGNSRVPSTAYSQQGKVMRGKLMIFEGSVAPAMGGERAFDARTSQAPHVDGSRWNFVTVNVSPEEVSPGGRSPQPLVDLGDVVDIRLIPATGSRGTELGARAEPGVSDMSAGGLRQDVRRALRQLKRLLEVRSRAAGSNGGRRAENRAHRHAFHVPGGRSQRYDIFKNKKDNWIRTVFRP